MITITAMITDATTMMTSVRVLSPPPVLTIGAVVVVLMGEPVSMKSRSSREVAAPVVVAASTVQHWLDVQGLVVHRVDAAAPIWA